MHQDLYSVIHCELTPFLGEPTNGLTLPKIFMDNMVLQGAPQNANIWGFLGRNLDPIELIMNCSNHVETQTYLPVQVRDTY